MDSVRLQARNVELTWSADQRNPQTMGIDTMDTRYLIVGVAASSRAP